MIKVLNVLICLCAAVYMFVRFKQGAGVMEIDIPSEYFRDSLNRRSASMCELYNFVLCLLCFECLTLVLPKIFDRFLKEHFSFVKRICSTLPYLRFFADVCCIFVSFVLVSFVYLLSNERKSFEYVDAKGNSTILVRDFGSAQE